jgi:hypothetical protein
MMSWPERLCAWAAAVSWSWLPVVLMKSSWTLTRLRSPHWPQSWRMALLPVGTQWSQKAQRSAGMFWPCTAGAASVVAASAVPAAIAERRDRSFCAISKLLL